MKRQSNYVCGKRHLVQSSSVPGRTPFNDEVFHSSACFTHTHTHTHAQTQTHTHCFTAQTNKWQKSPPGLLYSMLSFYLKGYGPGKIHMDYVKDKVRELKKRSHFIKVLKRLGGKQPWFKFPVQQFLLFSIGSLPWKLHSSKLTCEPHSERSSQDKPQPIHTHSRFSGPSATAAGRAGIPVGKIVPSKRRETWYRPKSAATGTLSIIHLLLSEGKCGKGGWY